MAPTWAGPGLLSQGPSISGQLLETGQTIRRADSYGTVFSWSGEGFFYHGPRAF